MLLLKLTKAIKDLLKEAAAKLKGRDRRTFMAKTVEYLGKGGQTRAEKELNWNRGTIRKGENELAKGDAQSERFSDRGRKKAEKYLPKLLEDIKVVVNPTSQADPTFRTTQLYTPLTAQEVRTLLIKEKGYKEEELPTIRTFNTKLNNLGFRPQKVAKSKPLKKIPETDAIFEQLHKINKEADETDGVLRLSIDAKARINIGPFSRGGKNRQGTSGADHDFASEDVFTPWGIFLPAYDEVFFDFTPSKVTADFIVDSLERLWLILKERFSPHTLVINLDNGPENSSHRTQFIKRMVEFSYSHGIKIRLAYYPPYHSKYNPIERVWGVLENHWNGELLDSTDKILGLASTMKWNGKNPVVNLIERVYETGIKLTKKAMAVYETLIERLDGLADWFVDIIPFENV